MTEGVKNADFMICPYKKEVFIPELCSMGFDFYHSSRVIADNSGVKNGGLYRRKTFEISSSGIKKNIVRYVDDTGYRLPAMFENSVLKFNSVYYWSNHSRKGNKC